MRRKLAFGILTGFSLFGAGLPSFETAAVHLVSHPSPNENRSAVSLANARRFRAINADLSELIEWAYEVRSDRISGPDDIHSKIFTYDIDATVPEHADTAQARLMLRRVLSERFGVTLHSVEKAVNGYALVVDKGGPKLRASKLPAGQGFWSQGGAGSVTAKSPGATMSQLATLISTSIGLPVRNQTGLDGVFEMEIGFSKLGPAETNAPTVFEVMKRMGLRLDKAEIPVETIIVDHANFKPTEN
jgi:uncharacterized protein (TIGR03435 family)